MIDLLLEPLQYPFLRHALVVCTVAGALCGLLGVYVTLRGLSYLGHGLSHAVFGGAAVASAVGVNLVAGAAVWGVGSGLAIGRLSRRGVIRGDAAVGAITTAGFAIGIVLIGRYTQVRRDIESTIFGSVLGVTAADAWAIAGVAVVTVVVVLVWYRQLLFTTFDTEVARLSGVRTDRFDALLMVALCAAILTSMRVMGVTLIAASLVVPAVAARLLTDSFARMLVLSTAVGGASGLVGMYLSYHLDVSSGATIVLTQFALLLVLLASTGSDGLSRVTGRRLADRTAGDP